MRSLYFLMVCGYRSNLIVGIPPLGWGFFQTGVRRRKYKLGPTKQKSVPGISSLARVYISSSSPQSERIRTPGGGTTVDHIEYPAQPRTTVVSKPEQNLVPDQNVCTSVLPICTRVDCTFLYGQMYAGSNPRSRLGRIASTGAGHF